MIYQNVSKSERIIRILIGFIIIILSFTQAVPSLIGKIVIIIVGIILIVTGITRWCPMFSLFKHSSKGSGIDKITRKDIEEAVKKHSMEVQENSKIEKITPEQLPVKKDETTQNMKEEDTISKPKSISAPKIKMSIISGVGKIDSEKLKKEGLENADEFFARAKTKIGRDELALKLKINSDKILKWANFIDLLRIENLSKNNAILLNESGVETISELKKEKPEELLEKIKKANEKKKISKTTPSIKKVEAWIENSKTLNKAIKF